MEQVIYYTGTGTSNAYFFSVDDFRELCINELNALSNATLEELIRMTGAIKIDHAYMQN